jgi:hypothetical protein
MHVQRRREWMHVTSTGSLTHYQVHPSRGHEALDAIGILAHFTGTSVHDGWATYFLYPCKHALCLVHVLRDLTYLAEELGLWWAAKLPLSAQEAGFLWTLSRPVQQAIPTFGSYRAQTPTFPLSNPLAEIAEVFQFKRQ